MNIAPFIYNTKRDVHISHLTLVCIAVAFGWLLWTSVNIPVYLSLKGKELIAELATDFYQQIIEVTVIFEISLLYIQIIVRALRKKENNIHTMLRHVMILAFLNGLSSFTAGLVYKWLYPEENLFLKVVFTDYVDLSVITTAYIVLFLMIRYKNESEARLVAQLENLSLQTDNHFIFNCFSTLSGLIDSSPEQAEHFLQGLSKVYRYLVTNGSRAVVPLQEELSFVKDYMSIATYRYNGISFDIDRRLGSEDGFVCPVSLQSLVENAVKHNRRGRENLRITLSLENGYIGVSNNILPLKDAPQGTGVGLQNLVMRYSLLTERAVTIRNDGKTFTVRIPIIHAEELKDESFNN